MDNAKIKGAIKVVAAAVALFAGKVLAEKGFDDFKRAREAQRINA